MLTGPKDERPSINMIRAALEAVQSLARKAKTWRRSMLKRRTLIVRSRLHLRRGPKTRSERIQNRMILRNRIRKSRRHYRLGSIRRQPASNSNRTYFGTT